ncbi:Anti-sigma factor [Paramixta manurensis]|uniref:Anti-sigma factor n=1 Tax=Paramixta manurensis TaxID=2740817 RepID=A0A6M8UJM9_9GAMM|nr:Anti-sigma factor [Erwiniaceae bacterium PD-1]
MTLPPDEHDLHAWMDGEADEATAKRVERYLAENPEAAGRVAGWRHDAQLLRQAMHAQKVALDTPEPQHLRRRVRQQRQWKLATACALVLSLSLGGYTGWQLKDSQMTQRHLPMEDAVQAYKLFGDETLTPLDVVASQQADLAHWVARYFINGNPPPNLEQYGFRLLGARLMATEQGPAALVMYQDPQGTRVAWYIRPQSPTKLPHGQRQAEDVMAQYWSDQHYNYALVTPMNTPDVGGVRKAVSLATS